MTFPNPYEALEDFFEFLHMLNIEIALTTFVYSRNQPVPEPNSRLKEDVAQIWCEQMDLLLVSFHHSN